MDMSWRGECRARRSPGQRQQWEEGRCLSLTAKPPQACAHQKAELFQASGGGSRKLSVSGAGEVFVAGKLVSDDDQEAGGLGDAAIVTSGGISAGKSAILGGKLNVRDTSDASASSMGSIFTAGGMQVTKKLLVGDEVAVGLGKAAGAGARSIKIWSESDGVIQVRSGKDAASRVELLNGQQRAFVANRNGTSPLAAPPGCPRGAARAARRRTPG